MKSRSWKFAGAAGATLAIAALASTVMAQPRPTGATARQAVQVKGMQRSFIVYTPRNVKPNPPLLFVFHGSGGDGEEMRDATAYEFDALADAQGFIVVYPDGFQNTWNDCRKGSPQPARAMNIDDESFIEAMIAKEAADHKIDTKRVFAAGWSNGGQLGYRLALERAKEFAAVAAISAGLPTTDNLACTPSGASMPVMIINGTDDPINPFKGGQVTLGFTSLGNVLSSEGTAQYFAKLNGQTSMPKVTRLPHKKAADPTYVDEMDWLEPGKPGVVMYAVHGGGHVIPQPYIEFPSSLGRTTSDLDAPKAIWDFFTKAASRP